MSEQFAKMTYRLSDGTETTYLVELQPESDYSLMDKKFYLAGIQAEQERIIKLLEDDDQVSHIYIDRLIALIKGEK